MRNIYIYIEDYIRIKRTYKESYVIMRILDTEMEAIMLWYYILRSLY